MLCESFDILSHKEKIEYFGKLLHAVQSSDKLFVLGQSIIRQAEEWGVLDDVVILPDRSPETDQ